MDKPKITRTLVKYLKEIYPLRKPSMTSTDREIYYNVGQVDVVEHLANLLEQQEKKK